jgi:hypothetical protein
VWLTRLRDADIRGMSRFKNPILVHGAGVASIVFFSACALFAFSRFWDRKAGLVLNAAGFIDNSSGVAAGFVPWTEVQEVSTFAVGHQRMLVVKVRHPARYIQPGNPLKRVLNRANQRLCGSPIAIRSKTLNIDLDELPALFDSYVSRANA